MLLDPEVNLKSPTPHQRRVIRVCLLNLGAHPPTAGSFL